MKGQIKAMEIERLDAFWLGFKQLLADHRMEAAVLVLDDGTGRVATMAWPGCPSECSTRTECAAGTLTLAINHLGRAVEKLEAGTATTRMDEDVPVPPATTAGAKKLLN